MDFSVTGVRVSSTLQLHRMMMVTTGLIVRELGQLPLSAQTEVEGAVPYQIISANETVQIGVYQRSSHHRPIHAETYCRFACNTALRAMVESPHD
jgi:hypothetical protein